MANKSKIKELLNRLNNLEGLPTQEVGDFADQIVSEKTKGFSDSLRNDATLQLLDTISKKLEQFKTDFNLSPIDEQLTALTAELETAKRDATSAITTQSKAFETALSAISRQIDALETQSAIDTTTPLAAAIDTLRTQLGAIRVSRDSDNTFWQQKLSALSDTFTAKLSALANDTSTATLVAQTKTDLTDAQDKLRSEFIQKLSQQGGGQANRNIKFSGSILTRYTDLNLLGASFANNDTTKMADVTLGGGGGGSGTVTSVSGTTNRITVATGTTTPVIDISGSYVGQSSITTLGTITTGVWNSTPVTSAYGGNLFNIDSNTPLGTPLNNVYRIRHSFNNFLANSSFEAWLSGTSVAPNSWTLAGDATVSRSSTSTIGTYSAQIVFGTANTGEFYQTIGTSTLVDYTFSAYVQRTAGTGTARLVAQRADSPFTEFASVPLPTTAGWQLITLTVKPSAGTQMRFSIKSGNTTTSTWLIDEAMFQESLGVASAWLAAYADDTNNFTFYGNLSFSGGLTFGSTVMNGQTGTNNLVFSTSPTLVTPVLGAATATSLAIGGATALDALDVTGSIYTSQYFGVNVPIATISANTWTAAFQSPAGTQNIVNIGRPTNTVSTLLQFSPFGANSPTNVNWFMGMFGNSDSFSFGNYDGSSSTTYFSIADTGGFTQKAKTVNYNNINTAGWGIPAIYGSPRLTAQTAAVALTAYTVGAADGSFWVSANVLVTTATIHNFTVTCAYTDEGNTARVLTLQFSNLTGTFLTAITNTAGTVPYEGVPLHIRCKAGTTITIASAAGGTYTTVVYNIEGCITQIS